MKNRKRKSKSISPSWFSFPQYILVHSSDVYEYWRLSLSQEPREKENLTKKGNDKQVGADSLLSNTTSLIQQLYQISKPKLKWFLRNL